MGGGSDHNDSGNLVLQMHNSVASLSDYIAETSPKTTSRKKKKAKKIPEEEESAASNSSPKKKKKKKNKTDDDNAPSSPSKKSKKNKTGGTSSSPKKKKNKKSKKNLDSSNGSIDDIDLGRGSGERRRGRRDDGDIEQQQPQTRSSSCRNVRGEQRTTYRRSNPSRRQVMSKLLTLRGSSSSQRRLRTQEAEESGTSDNGSAIDNNDNNHHHDNGLDRARNIGSSIARRARSLSQPRGRSSNRGRSRSPSKLSSRISNVIRKLSRSPSRKSAVKRSFQHRDQEHQGHHDDREQHREEEAEKEEEGRPTLFRSNSDGVPARSMAKKNLVVKGSPVSSVRKSSSRGSNKKTFQEQLADSYARNDSDVDAAADKKAPTKGRSKSDKAAMKELFAKLDELPQYRDNGFFASDKEEDDAKSSASAKSWSFFRRQLGKISGSATVDGRTNYTTPAKRFGGRRSDFNSRSDHGDVASTGHSARDLFSGNDSWTGESYAWSCNYSTAHGDGIKKTAAAAPTTLESLMEGHQQKNAVNAATTKSGVPKTITRRGTRDKADNRTLSRSSRTTFDDSVADLYLEDDDLTEVQNQTKDDDDKDKDDGHNSTSSKSSFVSEIPEPPVEHEDSSDDDDDDTNDGTYDEDNTILASITENNGMRDGEESIATSDSSSDDNEDEVETASLPTVQTRDDPSGHFLMDNASLQSAPRMFEDEDNDPNRNLSVIKEDCGQSGGNIDSTSRTASVTWNDGSPSTSVVGQLSPTSTVAKAAETQQKIDEMSKELAAALSDAQINVPSLDDEERQTSPTSVVDMNSKDSSDNTYALSSFSSRSDSSNTGRELQHSALRSKFHEMQAEMDKLRVITSIMGRRIKWYEQQSQFIEQENEYDRLSEILDAEDTQKDNVGLLFEVLSGGIMSAVAKKAGVDDNGESSEEIDALQQEYDMRKERIDELEDVRCDHAKLLLNSLKNINDLKKEQVETSRMIADLRGDLMMKKKAEEQ